MTGVDTVALESLLGADGWVAGLVCAFPAETVAVTSFKSREESKKQSGVSLVLPLLS
jgi:4-hydroxy-tetrahydrodipicolinate synthase